MGMNRRTLLAVTPFGVLAALTTTTALAASLRSEADYTVTIDAPWGAIPVYLALQGPLGQTANLQSAAISFKTVSPNPATCGGAPMQEPLTVLLTVAVSGRGYPFLATASSAPAGGGNVYASNTGVAGSTTDLTFVLSAS